MPSRPPAAAPLHPKRKHGAAHQVLIASDATGHTAEVVVRAALAQFRGAEVQLVRRPHIRTAEDVRETVREAREVGGLIVHTLVAQEMRSCMLTEARSRQVPTIDLFGPLLLRLEDLLSLHPLAKPGLFRDMDAEYRRRFEVMDFTVRHDDGQDAQGLLHADLVLVGVSRTSKTPLSIFLAWRGLRVANVPIVQSLPLPEELGRVAPHGMGLALGGVGYSVLATFITLFYARASAVAAPADGDPAEVPLRRRSADLGGTGICTGSVCARRVATGGCDRQVDRGGGGGGPDAHGDRAAGATSVGGTRGGPGRLAAHLGVTLRWSRLPLSPTPPELAAELIRRALSYSADHRGPGRPPASFAAVDASRLVR